MPISKNVRLFGCSFIDMFLYWRNSGAECVSNYVVIVKHYPVPFIHSAETYWAFSMCLALCGHWGYSSEGNKVFALLWSLHFVVSMEERNRESKNKSVCGMLVGNKSFENNIAV